VNPLADQQGDYRGAFRLSSSTSSKRTPTRASAPNHIDPTGYLDDLLAQASPDLMRQILQDTINLLLSVQADQVCGAEYGTTSVTRTNRRNGYRDLDTHVGTVDVAVPKLRHGSHFPDRLLEHRTRVESALTSAVATAYLKGVSTRRMDDLVISLGITGISKSQVSTPAKNFDSMVADFRTRPLDAGGVVVSVGRCVDDESP
jgi:putative transposase